LSSFSSEKLQISYRKCVSLSVDLGFQPEAVFVTLTLPRNIFDLQSSAALIPSLAH